LESCKRKSNKWFCIFP